MSPVTSLALLLVATALAALPSRQPLAESIVRFAAGTALAISWLAVLAISFDASRLADVPSFPGMAVADRRPARGQQRRRSWRRRRIRWRGCAAPTSTPRWRRARCWPRSSCRWLLGQARGLLTGYLDPRAGQRPGRDRLRHGDCRRGVADAGPSPHLPAAARPAARRARGAGRRTHQRARGSQPPVARRARRCCARPIGARTSSWPRSPTSCATRWRRSAPGSNSSRPTPSLAEAATYAHQVIGRQLRHLVRLIDDLLDVSRITANKLDLRLERLSISEVLHQSVETSRTDFDRARHTLTLGLTARARLRAGRSDTTHPDRLEPAAERLQVHAAPAAISR